MAYQIYNTQIIREKEFWVNETNEEDIVYLKYYAIFGNHPTQYMTKQTKAWSLNTLLSISNDIVQHKQWIEINLKLVQCIDII